MKKSLLLLFVLAAATVNGQFFRRTYSWGSFNTFPAFAQAPDGGFALAGSYSGATTALTGLVVFRTDSAGNLLWTKTFGGSGVDQARDIISLPDSGWLFVGYSNSYSFNNDYDGYVIRLDIHGDTVWTRNYGGSGWDFLHDAHLLPNGNILLTGTSSVSGGSSAAGWMLLIDSNGNTIRQRTIQNSENVTFLKGGSTVNGDLLAGGFLENPLTLERKSMIIRTDSALLNPIWTYSTLSGDQEEVHSVAELPDGRIAFCGTKTYSGRTDLDYLIGTVTGSGILVWQEPFPSPFNSGYNDLFLSSDTLVVGGFTEGFGQGGKDFVVNRFLSNGQFISGCTIGKTQDEILEHAEKTVSGNLLLGGTTTSEPVGIQTMLFVRTDFNDCYQNLPFVIGINETPIPLAPDVFPNPAHALLNIRLPDGWAFANGLSLSLVTSVGETVFSEQIAGDRWTLFTSGYPSGLYRVIIERKDGKKIWRNVLVLHDDH